MTSWRLRVLSRGVMGHLVVCLLMLASAAAQQERTVQEEEQFEAMRKFGFLVGKWSGEARWSTVKGILELTATEDVHYEQSGLVLRMIERQRYKTDGRVVGGTNEVISYDNDSGTYRVRSESRHSEGMLKIGSDWRGMTIQFGQPPLATWQILRMTEQDEWSEARWVTEEPGLPRMFLLLSVRRQKTARAENGHP